jgi:putative ABC transport system permease protein
MLALKELLGSPLKYALIALAIGLVVSLTMVTSAMSEGLITGMTGAKSSLDADALAYQGDTYPTLERSVLSAADLTAIAAAPGVESVYGVGHAFATIASADEPFDIRVFGLGGRFDQLPIVEGSGEIGPGETVLDESAKLEGIELGDTLQLTPVDAEVTVIGFTESRRYVMVPVAYVDLPTWEVMHLTSVLGRMEDEGGASAEAIARMTAEFDGGATVAAVRLAPGATMADVEEQLDGAYTLAGPGEAARAGNGMPEMILAVDGIQVVSILIGALLVGVFFYITTLHKTGQIAAVKAIGASNAYLYRELVIQITVLVAVATVFGTALALGAGAGMPPMMAFDPDPARWALAVAAIFGTAYVGSLFSLRSILRIDPAMALGRTDR